MPRSGLPSAHFRTYQALATGRKDLVRELWEEEYKGKYGPDSSSLTDLNKHSHTGKIRLSPKTQKISSAASTSISKLVLSLERHPLIATERSYPRNATTNALEFWNTRYTTQPDLARFALDMLAIPMMSAECERVFSSAKHLITDSRNWLNPDIIKASKYLKHWFGKPAEEMDQELRSEVSEEVSQVTTMEISKARRSDTEDDDMVYVMTRLWGRMIKVLCWVVLLGTEIGANTRSLRDVPQKIRKRLSITN